MARLAVVVALLALPAAVLDTGGPRNDGAGPGHAQAVAARGGEPDRLAGRAVAGALATAEAETARPEETSAPAAGESVIAPPPETFDAPAAQPAPPPALLTAASAPSSSGGVWAVVIGIDDYPGSRSDLRASVFDADVVDYTLASYGVPANRRLVLRNTQASAAVIEQSLRWLVANAGGDSTAVLFYAGHVRKRHGSEWIVGADGNLVQDRRVADLLRPLAARHTWLVIAGCYGGGFTEALGPNRILTAAAPAGNLAYENAQYRNSYLVEYLFERAMMQGRSPNTVEQSYAWAYHELRRDHPNRLPVQYDEVPGELRLGTPPKPSPPPSSPPPSNPPPSNPPPSRPPPDDDDPDDDGNCLITIRGIAGCD